MKKGILVLYIDIQIKKKTKQVMNYSQLKVRLSN